jgi:hypothetical protein
MSKIDPEWLAEQVYIASKDAFSSLIKGKRKEHFYTFALFTDDSLQFLHPAANSEEGLQATVERYRKEVDPKYKTTSTLDSMRWAWGDWAHFTLQRDAPFREINATLMAHLEASIRAESESDLEEEDADRAFAAEIEPLWTAILTGFKRLEQEGFFGTGEERLGVTLLLIGDLPEERVDEWLHALNPPEVVARYTRCIEAMSEGSEDAE